MKDRKLLMIPGPIEFSPEVLRAMGAPTTSHLAPNFMEAFGQALAVWLSGPELSASVAAPEARAGAKRSRKAPVKAEVAEPLQDGAPIDEESREALIDEEVQIQIERLVARAAKVGAWGQAEEYCRARFTGSHLAKALAELRQAEAEALRKKADRLAA